MYLDISYGWQDRVDVKKLRSRKRRNTLRLIGVTILLIAGGAFLAWHRM